MLANPSVVGSEELEHDGTTLRRLGEDKRKTLREWWRMSVLRLNGVETGMPLELIDGRSYTLVRDLAEAMGARVLWDPETHDVQVVTIPWPETTLDLRLPSNVPAELLGRMLAGTGLAGLEGDFVAAEAKHRGPNVLVMAAHAALESGWGASQFARERNNLFGLGAWDEDPDKAMPFATKGACIDWYAGFITKTYLHPAGTYYSGAPTLAGMSQKYASDPKWAEKIVQIARQLLAAVGLG